MKLAFLSVLVATVSVIGTATSVGADAPPVARPPCAQIEFDSVTFDFGKVDSGTVIKHDFIFTNTGTATLEIKDVHPACGCTLVGTWDKSVESGKTGRIPLQFNSTNYGGEVTKWAYVTCNDCTNSNLALKIKGFIWRPFELSPPFAVFNLLSDSQTNEVRSIRITNQLDEPVTLSDLQLANSNLFRAELKTVKPGREFELLVTAPPPFVATDANPNATALPITIKTSSALFPTINTTAYLTVRDPVTISPARVNVAYSKLEKPLSTSVLVRNQGPAPLVLSDVKVNYPGAEVRVNETAPGNVFDLTLKLPAGFELKEDQKVAITMKSNHPKYPVITVPVVQNRPSYLPAREPVTISPARISVPPGRLPNTMSFSSVIRNERVAPLTLSDVKVNYPGAEVRVNETAPGEEFSLTLSLPAGFELNEGQEVAITMKSNQPNKPIITVPVIQKKLSTFGTPAQTASKPAPAVK